MVKIPILLAALFVAAMGHAAEPAKPNALTPKEIADGWVMLFDGETTFGWKTEGTVKVEDGKLVLGGEKAASATIDYLPIGDLIQKSNDEKSIEIESTP